MNDRELAQKIRKSKVRVRVTYLMSATYAVGALGLIAWLMATGSTELALGVFSGVASTTASITAFWFGSRGSAADPDGRDGPANLAGAASSSASGAGTSGAA